MTDSLTASVKRLALELGADKVGIAGRAALAGPPEADMDYVLPGARAAVSFLIVEEEEAILKFLSKEDPWPYRLQHLKDFARLGRIGRAVAEHLTEAGHRAVALAVNGVYLPGSTVLRELLPPFSHIYAAAAAGLGAVGWSGMLMTPEYGARVQLSSVVTDAPLEADQPLEKNPCDRCNICLNSCPGQYRSLTETVTFTLGGREITVANKDIPARCAISCMGFTGRSRDGKWSTWSPGRYSIPEDREELLALLTRLAAEDLAHDTGCTVEEVLPMADADEYGLGRLLRRSRDKERELSRTRPTEIKFGVSCGNCSLVCFETLEKRAKALKLLRNSGVVVENEAGEIVVARPQESAAV